MSNNLNVTLMIENQGNKHITHNTTVGKIDAAITASLTVPITATNAATISSLDISGHFSFTATNSGATAASIITVGTPAIRGLFRVLNSVGQLLTVTIAAQPLAAHVLVPGEAALLYSDGVNVSLAHSTAAEVGGFNGGLPPANAVLLRYITPRPFNLPAGLPRSQAYLAVAPTVAAAVFNVRKNGGSVGSLDFAVGANVATFTLATAVAFAPGDRLEIVAPNPANATAADLSFSLVTVI